MFIWIRPFLLFTCISAISLFSSKCKQSANVLNCKVARGRTFYHTSGKTYMHVTLIKLSGLTDKLVIDLRKFPALEKITGGLAHCESLFGGSERLIVVNDLQCYSYCDEDRHCNVSTCGDVTFVRDDAFSDSVSDVGLLNISTNTANRAGCAALCYITKACLSFFYNDNACHLHSTVLRATDQPLVPSPGHVYYRSQCWTKVSPVPFSTIHTSNVNGTEEVNVVCDDDYKILNESTTLTCDADGYWSTLSCGRRYWKNPVVPFDNDIPGNMFVGASINFTASMTPQAAFYTFDMFYENGDEALQVKALGTGDVSWKRRQGGAWGTNTLDVDSKPFTPVGKVFSCLVETQDDNIKFSVDGSELFTFGYVQDPTLISRMRLGYDLQIHEVDMRVLESP